jgi:homoserine O-acetyltransferase
MQEQIVAIGDLQLDCGEIIAVNQQVTMYGEHSKPAVLISHALTGSSRVAEWWPGIVGAGCLFDPADHCIIGINALGSCYGSTGPSTWHSIFPRVTVRDIVRAQARALDELGFLRLEFVVGGSLGGMQALQRALDFPERIRCAVIVSAHDHHSAMGIALNSIQRECLEIDPTHGLRTARKLAILTYKSDALLRRKHDRLKDRHGRSYFDVEGYLDHQADAFENRMDAATYATLTHAMDSFDLRSESAASLPELPELLFVGVTSDWLFRPEDIQAAAVRFAALNYQTSYLELSTDHGHDAFLSDQQKLGQLLGTLLVPK